jgi:AraC family transcriptional regulator
MTDRPNRLRAEYRTRINRVIDHIGAHLDGGLRLEELARVACFSPFHFHRIFAALAGETLGDHIRRRRLEAAAILLRDRPDLPVTEIALRCGFGSSAAFARAFRQRFAMSASGWRQGGHRKGGNTQRKAGQARRNRGKDGSRDPWYTPAVNVNKQQRQRRKDVKVEIRQLPGYHVAYMRHIGPYGPAVSAHWKKLNTWAGARDLSGPGSVKLGISHDDPSITPPDKCRYDACVRVPDGFREQPGVNVADIPGGRYAVLRFRGTDREIGGAWTAIYRDWLPGSGYQCDDRPCFELYGDEHQCLPGGRWECDICIPVRPL